MRRPNGGAGQELLRRSPAFQHRPPPTSQTSPGSRSAPIVPEPAVDQSSGLRRRASLGPIKARPQMPQALLVWRCQGAPTSCLDLRPGALIPLRPGRTLRALWTCGRDPGLLRIKEAGRRQNRSRHGPEISTLSFDGSLFPALLSRALLKRCGVARRLGRRPVDARTFHGPVADPAP